MRAKYLIGAVLALLPVAASASETITCSFDAADNTAAETAGLPFRRQLTA